MSTKTPISILQEYCVSRREAPPVYEVLSIGTLLVPKFLCKVKWGNMAAEAVANNKKEAKQACASQALNMLQSEGLKLQPSVIVSSFQAKGPQANENYIGKLNEYASKVRSPLPNYIDNGIVDSMFCTRCTFESRTTNGIGPNKKLSKQHAAKLMWDYFKDVKNTPKIDKHFNMIHDTTLEIVKKFETLKSSEIASEKEEINIEICRNTLNINIDKGSSLSSLEKELKILKFNYNITVFQRNPLIVQLKAGNGILLMATGSSLENASINVLQKALDVLTVDQRRNSTDLITF